jgi:hypothetical protein
LNCALLGGRAGRRTDDRCCFGPCDEAATQILLGLAIGFGAAALFVVLLVWSAGGFR